jgi:hypothetical protein
MADLLRFGGSELISDIPRSSLHICSALHYTTPREQWMSTIYTPSLSVLQQLPRRALHPQLGIPPMRELEVPRQRLTILALGRRIDKVRLEMECRHLRLIVRRDFHREQAIARTMVFVQRRVAAAYDDLNIKSILTCSIDKYR